jgi:hypothetical protein
MKKVNLLLFSFLLSTQVFAGICKQKFQTKDEERKKILGITGLFGANAGFIAVSATAGLAAGAVVVPVVVAGIGGYWLISGRKPARLVKLIDQAEDCEGRLLTIAYNSYLELNDENQMTQAEFCEVIVQSDDDGSLCTGKIPNIKQVGKLLLLP